jgi:hypothetical protein
MQVRVQRELGRMLPHRPRPLRAQNTYIGIGEEGPS